MIPSSTTRGTIPYLIVSMSRLLGRLRPSLLLPMALTAKANRVVVPALSVGRSPHRSVLPGARTTPHGTVAIKRL